MPDFPPPPVTLAPLPKGWKYAGSVSPAVQRRAVEVLRKTQFYGEGETGEFDGVLYAFRREPHYDNHPSLAPGQNPDDPDAPPKYWHPGISVWRRVDLNAAMPTFLGERDAAPTEGSFLKLAFAATLFGVGAAAGYLARSRRG